MIRRLVRHLVPVAVSIAVFGSVHPAGAQLVEEESVGRLTIGGGLGVQLTSMSDVNDNIGVTNRFLRLADIRTLDKVREGVLSQLDVRYRFGKTPPEEPDETVGFLGRVSLGLSWGAVNTRSEFDVSLASARFFSRATTYSAYLLYHVPWFEPQLPRLQFYAGGGIIFLRDSRIEWILQDNTFNNFIPEGDLAELSGEGKGSGSGTGSMLMIGSSFQLAKAFSLALDLGYRHAKISNITLDTAEGYLERFPGGEDSEIVREPGDWAIIDWFFREHDAEWQGRKRSEEQPEGCADCPLYYTGGPLEVDYSGFFATLTFRIHLV